MRQMASGTISYTYRDAQKAESELPGKLVWVAPNSLYTREDITPGAIVGDQVRTDVLYVGRFAVSRK